MFRDTWLSVYLLTLSRLAVPQAAVSVFAHTQRTLLSPEYSAVESCMFHWQL